MVGDHSFNLGCGGYIGAFYNPGLKFGGSHSGDTGDFWSGSLGIDASKGETKTDGTLKTADEHHVYGASDTVQPPAVAINYIIKY